MTNLIANESTHIVTDPRPRAVGGRTFHYCLKCQREFSVPVWRSRKHPIKYCSVRCRSQHWIGDQHPKHSIPTEHRDTYRVWASMKNRVLNPKGQDFARYGGRGIAVCDRWRHSFNAFITDMGVRPSRKHTIDRIDNDGNYEPGNCRWATRLEQRMNQPSRIVLVRFRGTDMCMSDLSRLTGICRATLNHRIIKRGMTPEQAVAASATEQEFRQ